MYNGKLKIKLCRDWDLGQEEYAQERSLAHVEFEQCTYSHVLPITIKQPAAKSLYIDVNGLLGRQSGCLSPCPQMASLGSLGRPQKSDLKCSLPVMPQCGG